MASRHSLPRSSGLAGRLRYRVRRNVVGRVSRVVPRPARACALAVVTALAPGAPRPLARMRADRDGTAARPLLLSRRCRLVGARPSLMRALRLIYVAAHLPGALGVLASTRHAHPQAFPLARDTFAAAQALADQVVIAPTAPPRTITGLGNGDRPRPGVPARTIDPRAPTPRCPARAPRYRWSPRDGWALAPSRPCAHPAPVLAGVVVGIIATGGHIWLDALGGLMITGFGFASARA